MRVLDKFEQLICDSTFAVTVLGNVGSGDFELIPLGNCDPLHDYTARKARGLCVLGVLALDATGQIHTALALPLADDTVARLAQDFCRLIAERFSASPKDHGAEWLERLHSLPDPRKD
jgi:hypothetical protein